MKKTKLMAILNVSSDSCYSESGAPTLELAIGRAIKLQAQGADILDIGGQSNRHKSGPVDEQEELRRLIPVFNEIKQCLRIPMSIDTTRPRVAKLAIEAGATLVNDISGLVDPQMIDLVASTGVEVCIMHMRGIPYGMQNHVVREEGILQNLIPWFRERTDRLIKHGINPSKIIIDPGIGFGKTVEDNFKIIHNLEEIKKLGFRVLVGTSRKSFMGKVINRAASQLLAATLAINTVAILSSVDIIRVHDVEEHRDIIDLLGASKTMR